MALQFVTDISVDFYDKRYILINAKQYDKNSRFLAVTCYNHGTLFPLNAGEHSAYIRYKKPDNHSVFNFCEINNKGKILVELTEQMLAVEGVAYADLVVVKKGDAKVNTSTGEITTIKDASILSSMLLNINVSQPAIENSDVESEYEYDGLNNLLERAEASYEEVVKTSKSWAIGGTGIRDGENANNAKYWSTQSKNSSNSANESASNAAESANIAGNHKDIAIENSGKAYTYMESAQEYSEKAKDSEGKSAESAFDAKASETNAKTSEQNAKTSETNAQSYMNKAESYGNSAEFSASLAATEADNANRYMKSAEEYMNNAQSYMNKAESYGNSAEFSASLAATAAEEAAEEAAQNAVDNVNTLMSGYVTTSQEAARGAANSEQAALTSETNAKASEDNSKISESNAKASEDNAKASEQAASASAVGAYNSEVNAYTSEGNASFSEANALAYADIAQSYAVGGTGTRDNEDIDNAKYYYELINNIVNGVSIATVGEVKDYLGI